MKIIEAEAIIKRPPEEIFAVHSDFRKRPLWHDHVSSSEMLTPEPVGLGSLFRTKNKTLGFNLTTRETITVFDPPNYYCYELDSGPLHIKSCQRFSAVPEGTDFQLRVELQGRNWFGRLVLPLIARMQGPHFVTAAEEMKHYMER